MKLRVVGPHYVRRPKEPPPAAKSAQSSTATILCGVGQTTRVRLRVSPGAARAAVVGRHGPAENGVWKVRVAALPERGKANEAVLALLAETLAVPRSSVTLVSGGGSRDKIVELAGIEPDEIERRLATAGGREQE
jgi:uncharacterized protein